MKKYFVLLLLSISLPLWSKVNLESMIKNTLLEPGFTLIQWVSGDINKDGINDLVFAADEIESRARVLYIYLYDEDGQAKLWFKNDKALYHADEGGVWGDPLESIAISKNSLFLRLYGGSNWRWSLSYQFQYRNGGLYLIGHDSNNFFTVTGEGTARSYNLLSARMQTIVTDSEGNKTETWTKREKKPLIELKGFNINKKYECLE